MVVRKSKHTHTHTHTHTNFELLRNESPIIFLATSITITGWKEYFDFFSFLLKLGAQFNLFIFTA